MIYYNAVNKRLQIQITGRVQGVGFRPTVYRQAAALDLSGFVRNTPAGVLIEAEGPAPDVDRLVVQLKENPPRQARIDAIRVTEIPSTGATTPFEISPSRRSGNLQAGMPPDLATCEDCRAELFDSRDRRYRYPFINCTNCGPRFTIIHNLPYDREQTSMSAFALCPTCRQEYRNPADRRFDAQPNACPVCGPRLQLIGLDGTPLPGDPLAEAARLLQAGAILAIKGLGGYHLACDAASDKAIAGLRVRKQRPAKSLAVMFASLEQLRQHCDVSARAEAELQSPAAPIVILPRRAASTLSALISPDTRDLGAFLPYAPLHHLLLAAVSPLIMTSGNRADEPIAKDETELRALLGPIADAAFIHNRPIVRRADDSVLKLVDGRRLWIRRSRGIVPDPIDLPIDGPAVLACGAELKNTIAVTRGRQAFLSPHIGDLDNYPAYRFFQESLADFPRLLQVQPAAVAYDLHPDYRSTRYALGVDLPRIGVQHHHAHIAACLAENQITGPVIGVALDGTGYGMDGAIWGGEFLIADLREFRRAAHFKTYRLPGGEEAIRNPARMALSCLVTELGEAEARQLAPALLPGLAAEETPALIRMITDGIHAPLTSSAGRLFDAIAALLGINEPVSYEGQAAIRLQTLADPQATDVYPYALEPGENGLCLSFGPLIRTLVADIQAGIDRARLAGQFHQTLAAAVTAVCVRLREQESLNAVALSGGVFQNELLLTQMTRNLLHAGFTVYSHRVVPPNDGGIALGQAAVALARFRTVSGKR